MRADLRATFNGLNDAALMLVKDFAEGLARLPHFTRVAPPLTAPLHLVFSAAPQPVPTFLTRARQPYFLVDHTMRTVSVSRGLQAVTDTPASDLLGHGWEQYMDGPEELRHVREKWLIAAQDHQPFTHTMRYRTPSGEIRFLFMRVEPIFHPNTHVFEGFFGTVRAQTLPLTLTHSQEQTA